MAALRREDLIERLCRETGRWHIRAREGDSYRLRKDDPRSLQYLNLRYGRAAPSVPFQAACHIRFPLERPPEGLYARLLVRNFDLLYSSWSMDLGQSLEACLSVTARIPVAALTAPLFDGVASEILDEVHGLHTELRAKFRGAAGSSLRDRTPIDAGIHFIEPEQTQLASEIRRQLPER